MSFSHTRKPYAACEWLMGSPRCLTARRQTLAASRQRVSPVPESARPDGDEVRRGSVTYRRLTATYRRLAVIDRRLAATYRETPIDCRDTPKGCGETPKGDGEHSSRNLLRAFLLEARNAGAGELFSPSDGLHGTWGRVRNASDRLRGRRERLPLGPRTRFIHAGGSLIQRWSTCSYTASCMEQGVGSAPSCEEPCTKEST